MDKKGLFHHSRAIFPVCLLLLSTIPSFGRHTFESPDCPDSITQATYDVLHYWDSYTFSDTLSEQADSTFDTFVTRLAAVPDSTGSQAVWRMLEQAALHKETYAHFATLALRHFYGQSMTDYREPLYTTVLHHQLQSSFLSDVEKERTRFRLEQAGKNAVGQTAANFAFITRQDRQGHLHDMPAVPLLLFFFDPSCIQCQATVSAMRRHVAFGQLVSQGKIQMLAVCVTDDIPTWQRIRSDLPTSWTVAIAHDDLLDNLYDLHAFPVLYLLDSLKTVVQKNLSLQKCLELIEGLY